MALPNPFSAHAPVGGRYLTISLSDSKVQALFWQVYRGEAHLIQKSSVKTYLAADQVVINADQVLQELGKESEDVNSVIFAIEPHWVNEHDVLPARKPILKQLSEELSLTPVGYVVFTEALEKDFIEDHSHASVLFLYVTNQELIIHLIYQGRVVATEKVGRSSNPVADVTEALARINHDTSTAALPPQMLLASHELENSELQAQQQALLQHDWTQQDFSQPPTVELVERETLLTAIVKQAGASLDGAHSGTAMASPTTVATSFGVPVKVVEPPSVASPVVEPSIHNSPAAISHQDDRLVRRSLWGKLRPWLREHHRFVLSGFGAGLAALFLLAFVGLSFGTKAVVKLDLKTKPLSKEVLITVDPDRESSDPEQQILAAQTIEKEMTGSKSIDTTGVKLVGEKAQGSITIFNKTEAVKSFEAGTRLTSGKLVFTLDEAVQVASASVKVDTSGESKEYGKATAKATAVQIGVESNIEEKVDLNVGDFDSNTYTATTDEDFTGGSSREVRVVSDADRQKLQKELRQELLDKAVKELGADAPEGRSVVPTQTTKVIDATYSDEVGEEVDELSLDLTITVTGLSYSVADLKALAQHILQGDIPNGYELGDQEPQLLSSPEETASSSAAAKLRANISSIAVPQLNQDELKSAIANKKIIDAQKTLTDKDAFDTIMIQLSPSIAHQLRPRLPKDPAKIQLDIVQ